MSKIGTDTPNDKLEQDVTENDLPLHCPMPNMSLWNSHPRIFLPLKKNTGSKVKCPYCGTEYKMKAKL